MNKETLQGVAILLKSVLLNFFNFRIKLFTMNYLRLGNWVSLIASLVILLGLALLEYEGIKYAFSTMFLLIATAVWILAIPSYIFYHKASLDKAWLMDLFAIPAIIITFLGLVYMYVGEFLGIELILAGYSLEPIAGIAIYLTTKKLNFLYSSLFFWGAIAFTAGLPLYLLNLGIIAIIGDIVKMMGIVGLLYDVKIMQFPKINMRIKSGKPS